MVPIFLLSSVCLSPFCSCGYWVAGCVSGTGISPSHKDDGSFGGGVQACSLFCQVRVVWSSQRGCLVLFMPCVVCECSKLDKDRFMAPDIAVTAQMLQEGKVLYGSGPFLPCLSSNNSSSFPQIWEAVQPFISSYEDALASLSKLSGATHSNSIGSPLPTATSSWFLFGLFFLHCSILLNFFGKGVLPLALSFYCYQICEILYSKNHIVYQK